MSESLPVFIVMGVSSSGKSTVGRLLAQKLNLPFADADDYHPEINVKKMEAGKALNDNDRYPWLVELNRVLLEAQDRGIVMACSSLKEVYRNIMRKGVKRDFNWIYLHGTYNEILERMKKRKQHFMPPALLKSQFETIRSHVTGFNFKHSHTASSIVAHCSLWRCPWHWQSLTLRASASISARMTVGAVRQISGLRL